MKKYLLAALVVLSASTFAANVTVFGGVNASGKIETKSSEGTEKLDAKEMGYFIGVEAHQSVAKLGNGNLEVGLGTKYDSTVVVDIDDESAGNEELVSFMPVYGSLKYTHKINNKISVYAQGKAGYAFAFDGKVVDEINDIGIEAKTEGGLYTGLGLGAEIGNYNLGVFYDVEKSTLKIQDREDVKNTYSKVALTVGYKFGK